MKLLERFGGTTPVRFDGAMGTEILKRGLDPGKSTILQNFDAFQVVFDIHRQYIKAGVQVITANTFAGNYPALKSAGIEACEEELNLQGILIARAASEGKVKVAADIGPTGLFHRQFQHSEVRDIYRRQASILQRQSPDFYLIETMFDLREALAALEGVKEVAGEVPVAVSMTFKQTKRGFFTIMGDEARSSLGQLESAGADAVGANCTLEPEDMLGLLRYVRPNVKCPLIIQPNAGQPEMVNGEMVYRSDPEEFAQGLVKLAREGADIIGGCCGSTPEMMALANERLKDEGRRMKEKE